ncbi:fumarylacetoacetate hydrolase family protein [Streptomyces diastatochromogenes]|uniref:fumarylacetoacetate hydrolase family protein n=1 Tax=Streptomyces diastatochromogenes TaxID=42236 RepID=UPI002448B7B4|nr:fumarylacetoacetate hydrolase family protein [Streptomyces diastatochromogenes]
MRRRYASRGTRVRPGDIIGSGTTGNGCLADKWEREGRRCSPIKPGDEVTMTIDEVGTIRDTVALPTVTPHLLPHRMPACPRPGSGTNWSSRACLRRADARSR